MQSVTAGYPACISTCCSRGPRGGHVPAGCAGPRLWRRPPRRSEVSQTSSAPNSGSPQTVSADSCRGHRNIRGHLSNKTLGVVSQVTLWVVSWVCFKSSVLQSLMLQVFSYVCVWWWSHKLVFTGYLINWPFMGGLIS